jgi:hypothetical protein
MKDLLNVWFLLAPIFSLIATWAIIDLIIPNFTHIGNLELIIFASLIGFGSGMLVSLVALSTTSVLSSGLANLFAFLFWSGAYYSIIIGTAGSLIGAGYAIFTELSVAQH